ncbi:MAG: hypothetical protein GX575_19805 [Candidatus Anammoximicrobium sp.]|nr:hypothetical protein [Candidatus Anammoximicrobium sp.]
MSTEAKPDIEKLFAEGRPIDEAMSRAVRGAIERHKQAGKPMAVWGDGKTVWIDPAQVDQENEEELQPRVFPCDA